MRKPTSLVLAALLCTAVWLIPFADAQDTPLRTATATSAADLTVVSKHFPERYAVQILCWSVHDEKTGPVSQIVVLQTDREGVAQALWQSPLDDSYSPKIQFLLGVALGGLPVALVERQTGAASSVLDVIGRFKGRIQRLQRFDGSDFDLRPLDGADRPSLIVHTDVNILDVPEIYRWVGARFIIDSAAHPDFYRQLLQNIYLPPYLPGLPVNLAAMLVKNTKKNVGPNHRNIAVSGARGAAFVRPAAFPLPLRKRCCGALRQSR